MELQQKAKTEVYHFECVSSNPLQAPYKATLTVEDGIYQTCDVSIERPTAREHWAFYALVAAKINQICKDPIILFDKASVETKPIEQPKVAEYNSQEP